MYNGTIHRRKLKEQKKISGKRNEKENSNKRRIASPPHCTRFVFLSTGSPKSTAKTDREGKRKKL
ncbi:CLUMA_CG007814, isoform A [Clunio marinus]|uniref:CLUMA_CG007814, isoform A n=1 Tax=Clunio marinus TaxID=568069 RepID=A0A1J1I264_9DIPT|nr:CLUMA_CG007814, isoform A [Clunio marinus]